MASKAIRGITVEIGADTTKLGKALESSEQKSKSLQGELRQIEKLLKFDPTNVELLTQKQDVLKNAISETSDKLNILKEAEAQVVAQFERGEIAEEQLRAFQREIVTTEKKLADFQSDLESLNSAVDMSGTVSELDKLTAKINDQEAELSELKKEYTNVVLAQGKTSDEARELESKMSALNDELKENKEKLNDAEGQAREFADSLDEAKDASDGAGDGFTIMKGALADLVSNIIQSAISAIGNLVGSILDLTEATEEYRSMQAKLEGSAQTFGYSIEFAKDKYEEFYKYVGDDQMATNAITNLMGLGTSTESVTKLAEGAIGVWASYGDSIPIESLTESINETVNAGKVTGTFADTINWAKDANENLKSALSGNKSAQQAYNDAIKEGLPVEDAFNEALAKITDSQERADVVAQFLNTTYGDSKKTYDELSDSIIEANEAELALKETQAELGETVAPVNNALTEMKTKALEALLPIIKALVDGFMSLYNWLQEHPVAMKIVTAVVIALAVAFGILATALAIQGLIKGVTMAFQFLNTTLLANPIVLIIAAIAGLVLAFKYLWDNCEEFRQFWIDLWDGIKSAFSAVVDWLGSAAESIADFFVSAWNKIKEIWSGVGSFFSSVWSGIKNAFSSVGSFFSETFSTAWSGVKNAWSGTKSFFGGVWSGIKHAFSSVGSWFKGIFSEAWTNIKGVFSDFGDFFGGLWNTIKNKFSSLGTSIANAIGGAVKSGINGVISLIEGTINGAIGLINGAIGLINEIPGVNLGKISKLSFPRLARGGVVNKPTFAEIGEDGAEAIIPLERNTEWLDKVAQRLERSTSGADNVDVLTALDRIYDRLNRLQVVLNNGVLVGEILDDIDAGLADKQLLHARGM